MTFRCLESLIAACGKDANAYIDSELLEVVSCTLSSSSRFVRESTFTLLNAIALTNSAGKFLILQCSILLFSFVFHIVVILVMYLIGLCVLSVLCFWHIMNILCVV